MGYSAKLKFWAASGVFAMYAPAAAEPLPFVDGKYVSDQQICSMSDDEAIREFGDLLGAKVRNIKGSELSNGYELFCTVKAAKRDGENVIFSAQCDSESEAQEIVASYGFVSNEAFRLRGETFELCKSSNQNTSVNKPYLNECPWGKGIWRSAINEEDSDRTMHQFNFTDGSYAASGGVEFSEYRNNKLAWTATGTFGCSNGASICSLSLPSKYEDEVSTDFEDVKASNGERFLVFSSLWQKSYQNGGLKVIWSNGIVDNIDARPTPSNIFMLTECRN